MPRPPFSTGSSEARGETEAAPARKPPQDIAGLPDASPHPGRWRHGAQLSATTMSRLPFSRQAQTKRGDLVAEKALNGERGGAKARCQQAGDGVACGGAGGTRAHNATLPVGTARSPSARPSHRLGLCPLVWGRSGSRPKENRSCDGRPNPGNRNEREKATRNSSRLCVYYYFLRRKPSRLPQGPWFGTALPVSLADGNVKAPAT